MEQKRQGWSQRNQERPGKTLSGWIRPGKYGDGRESLLLPPKPLLNLGNLTSNQLGFGLKPTLVSRHLPVLSKLIQ